MKTRRSFCVMSGAAIAGMTMPLLAQAQAFPSKPIRFIVPLAPGGSADFLARLIAEHLGHEWGQPVIVEMKPGGGTVIGTSLVANAPADGYTLLFAANSLVINAKLHLHLPYEGIKAFEPVALMVNSPQVLSVGVNSPYRTFREWLEAAGAKPGTISLSSLGPDTTQHMAAEQLQRATGVQLLYVPFAGGALAVNAALGGHVDTVLGNLAEMSSHIEAGRLRPLAVTTRERLPELGQVPTVAESGYAGFESVAWFGITAPSGTPHEIVDKIADGVRSAMNDPVVREKLIAFNLQPAYQGPQEFASHISRQYERYSRIIEEAHIKPI